MKRAHIIANERAEHQLSWGGAFGAGLKRHGWSVTVGKHHRPADLVVQWGVRGQSWAQSHKASGGEVVILERGYVGDRFSWTSVSFGGGLNGRGEFRGPVHDGSRWQRHFGHLIQPWQDRDDGDVLIMGQVDNDMAVANVDIHQFYRDAARAYQRSGYLTRFRAHPGGRNTAAAPRASLADDLASARAVVTWSSNSGVDAVLAGVPTVAMDKGSMAYAVTGHMLGELPPTPDRSAWAHRLAWCQWQRDEIASGACWDHIGQETVTA